MWKIATIVLALTTIAGLVWGYMATKNANDTQAQMQAEIDQLKTQMTQEESTAAKRAREAEAELRKYHSQIVALKGSLRVDSKDLKQEGEQLKKLRAQYEQAQQAAAAAEASLNDKLNAANAKAELAQHCAAVMASGLTRIYEDVPSIVTYREVANVINHAQVECQGIVTVEE